MAIWELGILFMVWMSKENYLPLVIARECNDRGNPVLFGIIDYWIATLHCRSLAMTKKNYYLGPVV